MDINLIGFFGVALKENKELSQNRLRELQTLAAKTGYIVHPDCWNSSVLKWLMIQNGIKHLNFLTTFFKPLFSAVLCAITALLISAYNDGKVFTLLAIGAAGVVYFIFIFLFRTFEKSEISDFLKFGVDIYPLCR